MTSRLMIGTARFSSASRSLADFPPRRRRCFSSSINLRTGTSPLFAKFIHPPVSSVRFVEFSWQRSELSRVSRPTTYHFDRELPP